MRKTTDYRPRHRGRGRPSRVLSLVLASLAVAFLGLG